MLLERSCLAWPAGDGEREWLVRQRGSTRLFHVRRAQDEDELSKALGGRLRPTNWPVIRPAPVADPARRPAFRVVGDSALVGTLRELTGTAPAGVNIVAARLFDPQLLQRHVDADGTVLPVFELDHQLVIGPLLTGTSCPCVRCLYGRLYANTQQPVAFRTLLHAVARVGAAGLIGAEAAAVVDAEERSGLARSVLSCAADILGAAAGGADRPVFTLDLATGEWRRRDFAPLPGRVNEHAWKER